MINIIIGDIFSSKMQTLVNTINCDGVMGKGIAKIFKERFPEMFSDYRHKFENKHLKTGEPYLYQSDSIKIINFPTKNNWRSPSLLKYISDGLDYFVKHYQTWNIKSIAFPPLGCGNGGLDWKMVAPLMIQKLQDLALDIEIYAPFGTNEQLIDKDYLLSLESNYDLKTKGKTSRKLPQTIYPILEVVYQLQQNPYAPYVGRVIFQKIAYVFTQMIDCKDFPFKESHYGPYSEELNRTLGLLANSNIIIEENSNNLLRIKILSEYNNIRVKHKEYIDTYQSKIDKIVDLFSRIKDTEQAEEVATVLYSSKTLKKNGTPIKESDIIDYILHWKNTWNKEEKIESVITTIRNLTSLRWINTIYCPELKSSEDNLI